jgi:hypothetical protein
MELAVALSPLRRKKKTVAFFLGGSRASVEHRTGTLAGWLGLASWAALVGCEVGSSLYFFPVVVSFLFSVLFSFPLANI